MIITRSLRSAVRSRANDGEREILTTDVALQGGAHSALTWRALDSGHAELRDHVPRSASDGSPFEQPDQEL
jgi:hypothetical protein